MIKATVLSGVLLTLCVGMTCAAAEAPNAVLATGDGVMVIWNESKAHVTVEFVADKIQPADAGGVALLLDGRFFQIGMADPEDFDAEHLKGMAVLEKHMQYEGDYWNSQVGTPLQRKVLPLKEPLPPDTMIWEIEWPEKLRESGTVSALSNLFLTRVVGDRVMVVSTPIMQDESVEERVSYLRQVADSVRASATPVRVEEVQARLMKQQLQ